MEQRIHFGPQRSERTTTFRGIIIGGASLTLGVFWVAFHALPIDRVLPAELQQLQDRLNPAHPLVELTVKPEPMATPDPTSMPTHSGPTSSIQPALAIAPTSTPLPAPTATPPPDSPAAERRPSTYTVQPGDTLYSIARRYGISPQALAASNDLPKTTMVKVGQQLHLP